MSDEKERKRRNGKRYYERHKYKIKEYRDRNKDRTKNYKKEYYKKNKSKVNKKGKEWYEENKEKHLKKCKEWVKNNRDKVRIIGRRWARRNRMKNRVEENKHSNEWKKRRYRNNLTFNLRLRLRERVRSALKYFTKTGKVLHSRDYGIDYDAIIDYLKPIPQDIENYDIHHKKPLSTFNLMNEDGTVNKEEVKMAFAPENHKLILWQEHDKINHNKIKEEL